VAQLSYSKLSEDERATIIYALRDKLINSNSEGYIITPRGFNFDVDLMDVRFPRPEEDLLDRDK
jgi:hypothetical protein